MLIYEILFENQLVINRIVATEAFVETKYPGRWRLVSEAAPPAPVPQTVSRFQARAALMLYPATDGTSPHLLAQAEAAVVALNDPFASLAWAEAIEWQRNSPTVAAIGAALGLGPEQLDDLFRSAAGITA